MNEVSTVGIVLAKEYVFSAQDRRNGRRTTAPRRTVARAKLAELVAQLPPCLIGVEACSGAHEWARRLSEFGPTAGLIAPKFVMPYRKGGKNDGSNAEAICEAVARQNMRFLPIKSVEQRAVLGLHRVRRGFVEDRIAPINRIRGLLAEFDHVLPNCAVQVHRRAPELIEGQPTRIARRLRNLPEHVDRRTKKIEPYERNIEARVRENNLARRAKTRRGICPMNASALVVTVANGHNFKSERQFATRFAAAASRLVARPARDRRARAAVARSPGHRGPGSSGCPANATTLTTMPASWLGAHHAA